MQSWLTIAEESDFSIHNIPFGIGVHAGETFACTRIGDYVVNLHGVAQARLFHPLQIPDDVFRRDQLNDFIALGKTTTNAVRNTIRQLLSDAASPLKDHPKLIMEAGQVEMKLPVRVGDYTDFYSSIEHATNVGKMFRDPDNALLPNWRHIPVGYHGRASSIVVSGTPIRRPNGQMKPPTAEVPVFGPSKRLDFELEMAFVIGKENRLGEPISIAQAEDHIFGLVLFNDWSARDIQQWEYVPLGPFLGKNFGSSVSPWIVTLEVLEPFRVNGPVQEPAVLPYLQFSGLKNYDIDLTVSITPEGQSASTVCHSNFKYMYWNMCQQLAHHTINGCNVRVGDMMASGTISGPLDGSYGSMLELSWGGKNPISLAQGVQRTFIEDGDTVTMRGSAGKPGQKVGFGEVAGRIEPALSI